MRALDKVSRPSSAQSPLAFRSTAFTLGLVEDVSPVEPGGPRDIRDARSGAVRGQRDGVSVRTITRGPVDHLDVMSTMIPFDITPDGRHALIAVCTYPRPAVGRQDQLDGFGTAAWPRSRRALWNVWV